jgi:hypothetical protein
MNPMKTFFGTLIVTAVFAAFPGNFAHAAKPALTGVAPTPCDPSRPNCHSNPPPCDPSRPNCHGSPTPVPTATPCDPSRPYCHGTPTPCDPSRPNCHPVPTPFPTPYPTPCDPSRPSCGGPTPVTPAQLRADANREATRVAHRVIETYGRAETWNYNFVEGFRYGLNGDPSRPSSTQRGRDEGQRLGLEAGNRYGDDLGNQWGASAAKQEVAARFREILNRPQAEPNLSPDLTVPGYPGSEPSAIGGRLDDRARELQAQIRQETDHWMWYAEGFSLRYSDSGHQLDLARLFTSASPSSYSFSDRDLTPDMAFSGWIYQRFGGGFEHDLYDRLSSSQKDEYRSVFFSAFQQRLMSQYEYTRRSRQETPFRMGLRYGLEWNDARSYDQGLNETYAPAYRNAAMNAFRGAYSSTYPSVFRAEATEYLTHPVLEVSGVHLMSPNAPGFGPGAEVSVKLDHVANLGRVALNGKASLEGKGLGILDGAVTLKVPASTSEPDSVQLNRLALVQSSVSGLESNSVVLKIGSTPFPVTFQVDWKGAMDDFAALSPSSAEYKVYAAWIIAQLSQEWSNAVHGAGNLYRDGTSVLEKLVRWHESAPGSKRSNLRGLSKQIYNVQNTGGLHPSIRPAYKKLAARIN